MIPKWHSEHLFTLGDENPDFQRDLELSDEEDSVVTSFRRSTSPSVVLGLHSWECFAVELDQQDSQSLKKRSILAFELEDTLPCDGEDLAIRRISHREGELVLSTLASNLLPILEAAHDAGVYVRSITPLIFLALEEFLRPTATAKTFDLLLAVGESGIDVVWLRKGVAQGWQWLARDDSSGLRQAFERIESDHPRIALMGIERSDLNLGEEEVTVEHFPFDLVELAATTSARIVNGHTAAIIDLREGPLEPQDRFFPIAKSLRFAATSFVLVQVALIVFLLLRTHQYQSMAEQNSQTTTEAFEEVFPGERIPVGVLSRLESEHRRLRGTRGMSDRTPEIPSILPTLHAFFRGAPDRKDARYKFDRIVITPNALSTANGVARSFEDQEVILTRLRGAGFEIPELSASAARGGVSLRIQQSELKREEEETE
ncbi:MAG: hypothetical protein AAF664_17495 [Planctomycetota bacterium]